MKRFTRCLLFAVSISLVVAPASSPATTAPGDNAVVHWNEIALNTIIADSARATPSASSLYVAITQLAVYDAVMAFEGTNEPYAYDGQAPAGSSEDAAVAAAAHDVLVEYFPAQSSALDAAYADSLAQIPDGSSEDDGVAVGQAAADAIIALRANDGRNAVVPEPADGTAPGQWRRTSAGSVVTPYVAQVTPFLAESPSQFRAKGPNKLTGPEYARDFERTRLYGAKTGSLRTPAQTEIATFWTENTVRQYNRALRGLATERGLSTGDAALMFAMTDAPAADAMITCRNTKFHFLAWRPVTAIHEADTDGNPRTTADPSWQPLSTTALHPEYVSGHACLTGAITRGLGEFLGTKNIDLTMDSTAAGTTVHHFATVDDLRTQVEDSRVYGGDHFTTGGTDGTNLGDDLAKWSLKRFFEPTTSASTASAAAFGNDVCAGLTATIVGTPGDDTLTGTAGNDVIVGGPGADVIRGGTGDDVICGGPGDDALAGQGEDDHLLGGPGDDYLDGGGAGCCTFPTNTGDDLLEGGPGNDALHTSDFPTVGNTLHGDEGDDQLFVWSGGWAFGDEGKDVLRQFSGDAQLDGGNGADDLLDWDDGGMRNETVTLIGGNGPDTLASEDATSTSHLDGGSGPDTCTGGDTTSNCE